MRALSPLSLLLALGMALCACDDVCDPDRTCTDETPPELKALRASPDSVDTNFAARPVTVRVDVEDDCAGVFRVELEASGPSGEVLRGEASELVGAGCRQRGTFLVPLSVPAFSRAGEWRVSKLVLLDGQNREHHPLDGGTRPLFRQTGHGDWSPPSLHGLLLSPAEVDTSVGPQEVTVEARLLDDLSGVDHWAATFRAENAVHYAHARASADGGMLDGGWYRARMVLPQHAQQGVWALQGFDAWDHKGQRLHLTREQLLASQLAPSVMQRGPGDAQPPRWLELSFSPTTVSRGGTVDITVRAVDDLSGVRGFDVTFLSPTRQSNLRVGLYRPDAGPSAEHTLQLRVPMDAGTGTYSLVADVWDAMENRVSIHSSDAGVTSTQLLVH
jgi:hypothetical protein